MILVKRKKKNKKIIVSPKLEMTTSDSNQESGT